MSYIKSNKAAWEEAFDKRSDAFGKDMAKVLLSTRNPYLEKPLISLLERFDLKDKTMAHFCCNNGRELLSIMKMGLKSSVGFDIAGNMVAFANHMAKDIQFNAHFIETNILDIDASFDGAFDFILLTVGALCWFEDLNAFFKVVSKCLKQGGHVLIAEVHPLANMLATPSEPVYDKEHPIALVHSYFRSHPWIETDGMGYMAGDYESLPFTSFSHSMG
ncbi:MAG: class I SAM-dependent methyltransferase, partial [Acholeplasmataceae bacterium]|nr:class I SAM-dependent methyltransferase [Acholeplasmataceae bacterium]